MGMEREEIETGFSRREFTRNAGAATAGIAVAAAGAETFFADMAKPAAVPDSLAEINPRALLEAEPVQGEILAGTIVSMGSRSLVVTPPASSPVTVNLAPNAHVWRAGDATLSAHRAGEEVVLLGERRGNRFTAVSVMDVFRTWVGTINSRTGRILHTNQGKVVITPHTVPQGVTMPSGSSCGGEPFEPIPLDDLKDGDEILARGHLDQKGWMRATIVGTRRKDEKNL